jgi:ABC-2 type transport system ATP-binding protein
VSAAAIAARPDAASDLAIDVEGLTKRFGEKIAVDHFSLQVRRGQIYGFLGPNGSGKTTTIRMLCGLLTPDEGSGTCLGYDILRESALIKRHVGYMTQRFSLYEDLSIQENLAFVARMYAVPDRRRAVDTALERLGLVERRAQLAGTLSGGWKQRLALAACLLHEPQLLLLDEPTAGVDPGARREFWDRIHDLAHGGITVLVSTHYMDEAERCHELAYIAYGRLLAHGSAREVVERASLSTWSVEGENLMEVARALRSLPGVEMVVPFGNALHVSGTRAVVLAESLRAHAASGALRIEPVEPGLEDVFIHLMREAREP